MNVSIRDKGIISALELVPARARAELVEEALRCLLASPHGASVFAFLRTEREELSISQLLERAATAQQLPAVLPPSRQPAAGQCGRSTPVGPLFVEPATLVMPAANAGPVPGNEESADDILGGFA